MKYGVVKWFNIEKGFGFVESGGKDYFAHYSAITTTGFKKLDAGDKITFLDVPSPRGWQAIDIKVLDSDIKGV